MTNIREIPLTRGYVAKVDADDYEDLAQFSWQVRFTSTGGPYAQRSWRSTEGSTRSELMHRRLLPGVPVVDHKNHDGLDNRRSNLRDANGKNMRHQSGPQANNKSGFRGVSWHEQAQKWRADIHIQGRNRYLGLFATANEAARARDAASIEHYGEFAGYLNFPVEGNA